MKYTAVVVYVFILSFIFILVSGASVHQSRYIRAARKTTVKTTIKAHTTTKVLTPTRAPTTTKKVTATTAAAAPTSPAGSGTTYSGDGTWFDIGLGSCGQTNTDTELVAALNAPQMMNGANPNSNPMCGKQIKITNPANGKTVTVKIVDTCPPCSSGSVDLSPAAFSAIADLSQGRIKITWTYI